jgi:Zn-dependent protease with chaperone function
MEPSTQKQPYSSQRSPCGSSHKAPVVASSPTAELSELRAPNTLSSSQEELPHQRIEQSLPKSPLLFAGSIALLNAKITLGYGAAVSMLGTLAYAGATVILHNVSGIMISVGTVLWGLALAVRQKPPPLRVEDLIKNGLPSDHPLTRHVQEVVTALCERHNMPEPHVVVIEKSIPAASYMNSRRGSDAVLVTTGIVQLLDERELQGVIAHELSHQTRWFERAKLLTDWTADQVAPLIACGSGVAWFSALYSTRGGFLAAWIAIAAGMAAPQIVAIPLRWCRGIVSRANEIKTDLKACAMIDHPEAYISALIKVTHEVPEAVPSSHSHPSLQERTTYMRKAVGLVKSEHP